jgi:hypothetical protein
MSGLLIFALAVYMAFPKESESQSNQKTTSTSVTEKTASKKAPSPVTGIQISIPLKAGFAEDK